MTLDRDEKTVRVWDETRPPAAQRRPGRLEAPGGRRGRRLPQPVRGRRGGGGPGLQPAGPAARRRSRARSCGARAPSRSTRAARCWSTTSARSACCAIVEDAEHHACRSRGRASADSASGRARSWPRLLRAALAGAQQAPELPAALQLEVQAAQDALARGVAEFDGPQQSRSIVAFDDGDRPARGGRAPLAAAAGPGHPRPGLRVPRPRVLRHRPLGEGVGELPPAGAAQARPRALEGARLAEGRGAVRQRQADAGRPHRRLLGARGRPGHARELLRRAHRPGAHRLLPDRGAGGRLRGRGRAVRLPDRDAGGQHRGGGDRDARGAARARAGERLPRRRARRVSRSGSTASCAPPPPATWRPSSTTRRGRAGSIRAAPRRASRSRTSRSAATPSSCAAGATRASSARSRPRSRRTTRSTRSSSRTRSPRSSSPPTRRARASC